MLQPRLFGCCDRMSSGALTAYVVVFVAIFLTPLVSCQELTDEAIEVTRIKRDNVPENRDLTVLLVNDKQRQDSKVGRYHSVKPLIGLLTSTARTFIQDGVTTEFATQILGTTLDNGRIYAQLLTKTSLVLYSKPSNNDVTVQPTRVPSIFDEQWNVKEDLGFIDPEKFVVKNTDYLAPSKMNIVYASKPTFDNIKHWNPPVNQIDNNIPEEPVARKAPLFNEIPKYVKFDVVNNVDNFAVNSKKFIVSPDIIDDVNGQYRQSKSFESISEPVVDSSADDDSVNELNAVKVKNTYNVPTFTIKNEFSPIFYYIDNVESTREQSPPEQTKLPKKLFGQNSETKPKKTFTYVGFADFTTVVGDTVIIFSPNTETIREPNPSEINVFSPGRRPETIATKVTFLSADIPVATSTFNAYDVNTVTKAETPIYENNNTEKPVYKYEEDLNESIHQVNENVQPTISIQQNGGYDFNLDVIQPSEPAMSTTESTHYTDDLDVVPIHDYKPQATEPLSDLKPSTTLLESPKESVVTENNILEIFTKSEEETSPVGTPLTTPTTPTTNEHQDDNLKVTELTTESLETTESDNKAKFHEHDEVPETTTETKYDVHEEVICTNGLETRSTMTTEYKTLTYLTSYFIPLDDSTETSTSIKSDVVVESHIGYTTNFVCKTDLSIEPTDVISIDIQSSVHSSLEPPETVLEPIDYKPTSDPAVTEYSPKISSTEKTPTTIEEEIEIPKLITIPEVQESTEGTTSTTTTTESVVTTNSHTEVSVSTEHSSPPTENPIEKEKEDESQENEIDVIYKTLYTTYTYFTTFFGDQTSSVASNKAIETNIITSTIDLSNLDPSLLGALSDQEIAPTSVAIGRPTTAIAQISISNLFENKLLIESVEQEKDYSSQTPTPSLGEDVASVIKPDAVKTYFTTYTFFTTIYVGDDANICSRSEIYTNYVGPDEFIPTKTNPLANLNTRAQYDFRNCKQLKLDQQENSEIDGSRPVEVDMLFSADSNPLISENAYVTDVTSSFSKGERKVIDNNNILEDQISSESNIEEILPSPTLLLQTSYTTFTYFTTMYVGKDSSNVKSRLETVTNVVTETITPNKDIIEENTLPITYYTTFTYWTTLSKDNSTTITSREDIVSNIVTPGVPIAPTAGIIDTTPIDNENLLPPIVLPASPIDTTPIDVVNIPQKDLDIELKPSLLNDDLEHDDGKATFYTTYTYFTTFYVGNTSQIRSSLETVTSIVDNTKGIDDNQLGRKVQNGPFDQNLIQDNDKKLHVTPTVVKEDIIATKLPDAAAVAPTVLLGTYIDNLFAEVKPAVSVNHDSQRKIISSQVAVISGESTIVTNTDKSPTIDTTTELSTTTSTTENPVITPNPEVIESSVAEPETTTESIKEEDDGTNSRKKSRLTYPSKTSPFTPLIRPFVSKYRPTFSPKRVPPAGSSATTITRADTTPTITATPTLKSVRPSLAGSNKKQLQSASPGSARSGNRFGGARSSASNLVSNIPSASKSGFGNRASSIQPSGRRTGFRTSSIKSNSLDLASRSAAAPKIRPTTSSRLRNNKQTASFTSPPLDQNEFETFATQQEESVTEALDEVTEVSGKTTTVNPLLKFRRPPIARQPGTVIPSRTTPPTVKRTTTVRGRLTTTTRKVTTRSSNPLLAARRDRPNSLFPKRNLFKQPEPTPEDEKQENEQEGGEENEEILEGEDFNEDTDYDSSNRKERQVSTPATLLPRRNVSPVQIRPFRRRAKRQVDYGSRKYTNFRRPGTVNSRKNDPDPEPETEKPTPAPASFTSNKSKARTSSRSNSRPSPITKTTSAPSTKSPTTKSAARQPFIIRGESRTTTTTSSPAYRRKSNSNSRNSPSRTTTTASSRPKSTRLSNGKSSLSRPSTSRSSNSRTSRTRTTTSRSNGRLRGSFENTSGERLNNYNHIVNDGKLTVTHHIPVEVTVPIVNGRVTEYKNLLTASASLETLFENQVSTTIGALGKPQLLLASDSTELADNGATKLIKYFLHETPTTTIIFTPTTIRGRKTSYSHILPSTVYNVEAVTSTITPEINANLPLANLLLSQLLLGNQQPGLNPLLALQGNPLIPQQPIVQTPVTEIKTKTTTYVTTVTDARETILPITFRGRAILTTIVDPTINVITATEFLTETVVTTPTVFGPGPSPQLNSLLLPFLLQQQQQQQQQQLPLQTQNPLLGLGQPELNFDHINNDIVSKPNILTDFNSNEDLVDVEASEEVYEDVPTPPPPPTTSTTSAPRHSARGKSQRTTKSNKMVSHAPPAASSPTPPRAPQAPPPPAPPAPAKITSIVTLYVSGRHPGEFSTVLSTLITDETKTVRKRDTNYFVEVLPSILPIPHELDSSENIESFENSVITDSEKYFEETPSNNRFETQSLESIVGELSQHISYDASPTYVVKLTRPSATNDLKQSLVDNVS